MQGRTGRAVSLGAAKSQTKTARNRCGRLAAVAKAMAARGEPSLPVRRHHVTEALRGLLLVLCALGTRTQLTCAQDRMIGRYAPQ